MLSPEAELSLLEEALEDVHVSSEEEAWLLTPDRPSLRTFDAVPPPPETLAKPQPAPIKPIPRLRTPFHPYYRPLSINYRFQPPRSNFNQVPHIFDKTPSRYPSPTERVARRRVEKPQSIRDSRLRMQILRTSEGAGR